MSENTAGEEIGPALIARGWWQGSILAAVGQAWFELDDASEWGVRTLPPQPGERLVVVSQECDIVAASEPFVEAMPCSWHPKASPLFNAGRRGNSGRSFLLSRTPDGDGRDGGIVVDATRRVQIAKASLLATTPAPGIELNDRETLRRFRAWLGGRYSRPALDERIVDAVQKPILRGLAKLPHGDRLTEAIDLIREIRFFPLPEEPPYALDLVVLVDDESLRTDERIAGFLRLIELWLKASAVECSVAQREIASAQSLSVATYEQTLRLPLDYLTLSGEAIQGATPVEGIDHG